MASLLTDGSNPSDIGDNNNIKEAEECCVCVAVHVRPLIDGELYDGCQNCLTTFPKEPQVLPLKNSNSAAADKQQHPLLPLDSNNCSLREPPMMRLRGTFGHGAPSI